MEGKLILSSYPKIDLHGMDSDYASIVVNDFIDDNLKMRNRYIVIIHGIGSGILRKRIYENLRHDKRVMNYRLDIFNDGQTLVELKLKKEL